MNPNPYFQSIPELPQYGQGQGYGKEMEEMPTAPTYNNMNSETIQGNSSSSKSKIKKVVISVCIVAAILIVLLAIILYVTFWRQPSSELCSKGSCDANPLSSCSSVQSPGYYWVDSSQRKAVLVHCDISPCGKSGSWMRVMKIDMETDNCPESLCLDTQVRRSCRICRSSPGCSSDHFSTNSVRYSKVCGRIIAYQIGTPNAFLTSTNQAQRTINQVYVDGISLTHGVPRKHIWTFAADHTENSSFPSGCSCNSNSQALQTPPNFVGNNYFCDTADPAGLSFNLIFIGDPLWDGGGCSLTNNCCTFNNPPWFSRNLPDSTTDDIEMRMCRGDDNDNEDIALDIVELYVQ